MKEVALALCYYRSWRYWVNAIWAAVEWSRVPVDVVPMEINRIPFFDYLSRLLRKYRTVVLGISFLTTQLPQILDLMRLVKEFRAQLPNDRRLIVVAGGPHATGDPLGTLKIGFDIVVYGEGEATIVELLERVLDEPHELPRVCGTAWMEDSYVVLKRRLKPVDLDKYPPFPYWRKRFGPIEIMRGCTSACYFCQVSFMFGRPRYRSVYSVVEASQHMLKAGLLDLRFVAPNSLGYQSPDGIKPNHSALEELLFKLKKLASSYGGRIFFGSFPSEVRPDSVDRECAAILKRYVDNKRIIVGAQSGSEKILRYIHRGHTVEHVLNAVEILRDYGFVPEVDFIFGLPGEDEEDVNKTVSVMQKLASMGARIHAHTFMPLPGTPFHDYPPGKVDRRIKKVIAKLIGAGKAYGEWEEQEKLAHMIYEYRKRGVIASRHEIVKNLVVKTC